MRTHISPGKSLERDLQASQYGGIMGHDFGGTVEELGPDVPAGARTVGERVGGFGSRNSQSFLYAVDFSLKKWLQLLPKTARTRNTSSRNLSVLSYRSPIAGPSSRARSSVLRHTPLYNVYMRHSSCPRHSTHVRDPNAPSSSGVVRRPSGNTRSSSPSSAASASSLHHRRRISTS